MSMIINRVSCLLSFFFLLLVTTCCHSIKQQQTTAKFQTIGGILVDTSMIMNGNEHNISEELFNTADNNTNYNLLSRDERWH